MFAVTLWIWMILPHEGVAGPWVFETSSLEDCLADADAASADNDYIHYVCIPEPTDQIGPEV